MILKVSKGNSKLGNIPSLSLPPGITCKPGAVCYSDGCYARKFYRMRPSCRTAWDANYDLWVTNAFQFHAELDAWFKRHKPERFRWHVSGDIPDLEYFRMMESIAIRHRDTQFLAFTKRDDLVWNGTAIPNLNIVFSVWPGMTDNVEPCNPRAYMDDGKTAIPKHAKLCPGSCINCTECWDLQPGHAVVFPKH